MSSLCSVRYWFLIFLAPLSVVLAAAIVAVAQTPDPYPVPCHTYGRPPFERPDNQCTPGRWLIPGRTEAQRRAYVCHTKTRPPLSAADRRRLLAAYGALTWTGRDGEIDHRIPVWLGGLTVRGNLWLETGPIPNRKDRLEVAVRARVCAGTMRVRTAVLLFLGDWVTAYQRFVATS